MFQYIEEHSDATLQEVKENILSTFPTIEDISITTIFNHLDGKLISYKKQRYIAPDANTDETLHKRADYLNKLTNLNVCFNQVYIDESNFTIFTRRNYGRSPIGNRAVQTTIINGCKKVNIIAAVSPCYGWLYHEFTGENVNANKFESFIMNLINHINSNYPNERFVFIMDNAKIHKKDELTEICINNNILLLFLPPYSPYLNPIERCFSKVKSYVKKWLSINNDRLIATSRLEFGQKGSIRSRLLEEAINFAISQITENDVRNFLEYSRKYYPQIFRMEPILDE